MATTTDQVSDSLTVIDARDVQTIVLATVERTKATISFSDDARRTEQYVQPQAL